MAHARTADEFDGSETAEFALPLLVDSYGGRLHSLGLRFCGNAEDANDLVQEAFLRAFQKWHQFEGRSKASTWLFTIAARACNRMHRKRARQPRSMELVKSLVPLCDERMAVVPEDALHDAE